MPDPMSMLLVEPPANFHASLRSGTVDLAAHAWLVAAPLSQETTASSLVLWVEGHQRLPEGIDVSEPQGLGVLGGPFGAIASGVSIVGHADPSLLQALLLRGAFGTSGGEGPVTPMDLQIHADRSVTATGTATFAGGETVTFELSGELETGCASSYSAVRERNIPTGERTVVLADGSEVHVACDGTGFTITTRSAP